jgi:DNA-directed RNA polymerase subunit M/transcription elongation factor TFIIS
MNKLILKKYILFYMDSYTKYCFDKLKNFHPEYLQEIGIKTEEDILMLSDNPLIISDKSEKVLCTVCNTKNAIQRMQQMRSADEGETLVIYCSKCDKVYKL